MFRHLAVLGLMSVLALAAPAFAHDPGLSSAHLSRVADRIEARLTFVWSDLAPLVANTFASEIPNEATLESLGVELGSSRDRLVDVYSGDLRQSPAAPEISAEVSSANEVIVTRIWRGVPAGPLRVEFPVLRKMAFGHRMILTLDEVVEPVALLDARHATWNLTALNFAPLATPGVEVSATRPRSSWTGFLGLGVEHILSGFDHLVFLFVLLLAAVRTREVIGVVTTFTLAHSLTLAAAATGLVSLSPKLVEPLIAASIVYIGVENLLMRRPPRHRLAVVFGFGLVHGLGFATALSERLPDVTGFAIVAPLIGFNLGVELGQLAVAALLIPLLAVGRAHAALGTRLQPACSLVIAAVGVVWFFQRV